MNQDKITKDQAVSDIIIETDELQYCNFCKKKADFKCSNCLEAVYCTPEHQIADWPSHKRKCIRPQQKINQLKAYLISLKKTFFLKLSKSQNVQTQAICENMMRINEQILMKAPTQEHQIEYGSSICAYVKILITVKNFNQGQQILNNYLKEKMDFLKDLSKIPEKLKTEDKDYQKKRVLIEGKLKILSVIANLTHQLIRNSVSIIQILLKHCQKFYGFQSLQVSNIYFYLGHYLYFLNQKNKSIACFLVAARIRKENGVSCLYNTSLILMQQMRFHKAIHYFNVALDYIEKNGDSNRLLGNIYEGFSYCYKKLNHFDNTVVYLQKALCNCGYLKNSPNRVKNIKKALGWLSKIYKKDFTDDQIMIFPKQAIVEDPKLIVSNKNLKDFWNTDKNNSEKNRLQEWKKTFKKQYDFMKFQSKIPVTSSLVDKILFHNQFIDDKNAPNYNLQANVNNYVAIDLGFMEKLTAIQVRYLDELNLQLIECKEKSAVFDIVDNSKLFQVLNYEQIMRFYELNPNLKKTSVALKPQEDRESPYPSQAKKQAINPPKLDLRGVNTYKN